MHIASPIITTHSCESSAPIGCMALNSRSRSVSFSGVGISDAASAIRGSVWNVAASGGGDGNVDSQVSGARLSGSWARMSCRIVVPVRGKPMMKTGRTIRCSAISG